LDWAATLRKEAQRSAILRTDDIARRYGIGEIAVGNALRRQERRGLVEHISKKIYVNKLAPDFSPRELVGILRPNAYISLESALAEWGISTQSPTTVTCVTTGFPRKFRTPSVRITYRHIAEHLYWGFEEKRTRHGSYKIAEPEKAIVDWIYLQRQEGLPVVLDELNLKGLNKRKLLQYAAKYPSSVPQTLQLVLPNSHSFTSQVAVAQTASARKESA
jgi:predicted transcriptional regulator of viral defense system